MYFGENRDVLLTKCKLIQQNRKYDKKTYEKQIEEPNKKLQDITQAMETLILKTE